MHLWFDSDAGYCIFLKTTQGNGDKKGSGKCVCDKGYSGDLCNECDATYFKTFSNDTYLLCVCKYL